MSDSRLSLLLASETLADGKVLVLRPPMDYDLSALPQDRVQIVQGFFPDHAAWTARGYAADVGIPDDFTTAIVVVPRAKAEARALIAAAARCGTVVVDGLKSHGIESLLKDLRKRGDVSAPVSKAHGKAFVVRLDPDSVADWVPAPQVVEGWHTAPGVFSADGPDPGSVALSQALPPKLPGRVIDLGAGWGFLSQAILARKSVAALDLVEAEHAALEAARRNVTDERVSFHWADARSWAGGPAADHVVMNPPFHSARAADPGLGRAFITAAARLLKPSGALWMVANRHLPYEAALAEAFRDVTELPGPGGFKMHRAARPNGPRNRR